MKRSLFLPLFLLVGVVVGAAGALGWTAQRSGTPPTPLPVASSPYDTRPCRAHPSPSTCDGKMPEALGYADSAAGREGNEMCLDGGIQTVGEVPLHAQGRIAGTLRLVWSPHCEAYYAQTQVGTAAAVGMVLSRRTSQATYLSVSSFLSYQGGFSETEQGWSPLLFRTPDMKSIWAMATITWPDGSSDSASLDWPPSST